MSESVLGSQGLQAATLLDRQAIVETDSAGFDGVAPVQGLIDQPEPMSQLEIQIRDAQGALVRQSIEPSLVLQDSFVRVGWTGSESGRSVACG